MSVENYNREVGQWGNQTKRKLKLEVLRLVTSRGPGQKNQKVSVKRYLGEASKIDFAFPYYMVFVHKGAGRGYGGNKTGLFTRAKGGKGKTNLSSMGRMGTGKRQAKPWFNPVIEAQFPFLAEIIANYHGQRIIANIQKILIK
ncbi:MAG: hypothetical protein EOO07_26765 [Chitinophagaceae bacterium]|nr:MAG: hypothetical protein EOO07_26765 [Chitinophagaceae bacterium]